MPGDASVVPERLLAAYAARDWPEFRELLTPGCVYEEVAQRPRRVEGAEAVLQVFRVWAAAVPGARPDITRVVVGDSSVALEVEWPGARQAPFGDFSSAAVQPVVRSALIFYLEDERVAEFHHYYDSLVLYQVLGIGPQ